MDAVVLEEPHLLRYCRVPKPIPGPGDVLVKVHAATTCGTDLKAYLRGHPQIPMPGLFGHEYSGIVEAVGEGASFEPGDAVMGVHSAPCGHCFWCDRDQENLCEHIMATKVLGSYAEYLLVPAHIARVNLFLKPEHVSFERAALLEPLACVANAIETLHASPSDNVLVLGPGAIGLMFVAALNYLGTHRITLAGRNIKRLEIGAQLGAHTVQWDALAQEKGRGFDLVIECTGREFVWEQSIDFVRRGGTVMFFGGCPSGTKVTLDTKRIHYDQITMMSPFHFGRAAVRTARSWLLDHSFDIEPVLSGDRRLADAQEVFEDLKAGRGIKYVFRP